MRRRPLERVFQRVVLAITAMPLAGFSMLVVACGVTARAEMQATLKTIAVNEMICDVPPAKDFSNCRFQERAAMNITRQVQESGGAVKITVAGQIPGHIMPEAQSCGPEASFFSTSNPHSQGENVKVQGFCQTQQNATAISIMTFGRIIYPNNRIDLIHDQIVIQTDYDMCSATRILTSATEQVIYDYEVTCKVTRSAAKAAIPPMPAERPASGDTTPGAAVTSGQTPGSSRPSSQTPAPQ